MQITRRALLQGFLAATVTPPRQRGETGARPSNLALELARKLNRIRFEDLPPLAVEHAKIIIASTLASAAFGSHLDSARILRDLAKEQGGKQEAAIWFDSAKLPINSAARVNAVLSDSSASDDSDMRSTVHSGTTLTSAGLAVAERTGASGRDLLCAMVVGYEASGRIDTALRTANGRTNVSGVHASQVAAFSGAVAVGKLLKLTDEQMANAIGIIAVSMGGLSIGTNSWAREYMGANAAFTGVNAALAASRGYTVNEDILENPQGYFATYGTGSKDAAQILTKDTGEWDITKYLAIKLVPGAHALHASAEAAVNAARQGNVSIDDVAKILVSGPQTRSSQRVPKDMVEAIHSQGYFVASGIADKEFSWRHADEDKIRRPVIARLMGLIETDPSPAPHKYPSAYGATVTIVTKSGSRFTSTVDFPRGSSPRGIEWMDIDAKYHALMPHSKLPAARIDQSLKVIRGFEQVRNVSELVGLLKTA